MPVFHTCQSYGPDSPILISLKFIQCMGLHLQIMVREGNPYHLTSNN